MVKKLIIIAALISYSIYGWQGLLPYKMYTYSKTTNNQSSNVTWTIMQKENQIITKVREKEGITTINTLPDLTLQSYAFRTKDKKTDYALTRNKYSLLAKGTINGRFLNRRHEIGKAIWIQDFTFGFKPFMQSNQRELKFYILNPKDFSVYKMIARKEGVENLVLNEHAYRAERLTLTLPGFKGLFWSAKVWLEESSGDLIMYRANSGPNTPENVVTLSSRT